MSCQSILQFIEDIRATKGTKAKGLLLEKAFVDIPELSTFLKYVYDPAKSYYQTKLQLNTFPAMMVPKKDSETLSGVYNTLDSLNNKNALGRAGASLLAQSTWALKPEFHPLVTIILNRDIKAGVAIKSINKAYYNVFGEKLVEIPAYQRYNVMTIEILKMMDLSQGVFSQLKSDGCFGNLICESGSGKMISRSGSPIISESIKYICAEMAQISLDGGIGDSVYHGELLIQDIATGNILPRALGNGKINSIIQKGAELESNYQIIYRVWDVIPLQDWKAGYCDIPYKVRWNMLTQIVDSDLGELVDFNDKQTNQFKGRVELQESKILFTFEDIIKDFQEKLQRKEEGTLIKPLDMIWRDGDSAEGVKIKLEISFELRIIGFKDGDQKGKFADQFGSLECESECGKVKVNVSGIPDELRTHIHENRDYYLDKILEVTSNGVQDKQDSDVKSLFLPRWGELRLDKTTANTLEEMYAITDSVINNIVKLLSKD